MEPLEALCAKANKRPNTIRTTDGGAYLAIAVHCLMIRSGFVVDWSGHDRPRSTRGNPYAFPSEILVKYESEWVFSYTRRGAANPFQLHCSLHAPSARMLAGVREVGMPVRKPHLLAILLPTYINQTLDFSKQQTWHGLLQTQEGLEQMFSHHLLKPVVEAAVSTEPGDPNRWSDPWQDWWQHSLTRSQRDMAVAGLVLVAAAATAAAVLVWRKSIQKP